MMPVHVLMAIALEAGRDVRTVRAVLAGRGSPLATQAVNRAMDRLGIAGAEPTGAVTGATMLDRSATKRSA